MTGAAGGRQPLTPRLLGLFFAFATLMCGLAGATLLNPGGALDGIWQIKPDEHRQLLAMGPKVGLGFLALAFVMLLASIGTFRRRRWAWPLALAIFTVNALGDAARIPMGAAAEGLIGIAATGLILWWLTRPKVRGQFDS